MQYLKSREFTWKFRLSVSLETSKALAIWGSTFLVMARRSWMGVTSFSRDMSPYFTSLFSRPIHYFMFPSWSQKAFEFMTPALINSLKARFLPGANNAKHWQQLEKSQNRLHYNSGPLQGPAALANLSFAMTFLWTGFWHNRELHWHTMGFHSSRDIWDFCYAPKNLIPILPSQVQGKKNAERCGLAFSSLQKIKRQDWLSF